MACDRSTGSPDPTESPDLRSARRLRCAHSSPPPISTSCSLAARSSTAHRSTEPTRIGCWRCLHDWTDLQAVSNLLMHPQVIPGEHRNAEVQRGLDDVENPYVRLAAVVGIGELDLSPVTDVERNRSSVRYSA